MNKTVFLVNMFPDFEPPEALVGVYSQAAIVAADIDPNTRRVTVAVHSETYVSQCELNRMAAQIAAAYGLQKLELIATHPAHQLTQNG